MIHTGPNTIAILMATYNGERHLKEQIDSILAQTCSSELMLKGSL